MVKDRSFWSKKADFRKRVLLSLNTESTESLTAADALRGGDGDVALARARGPPHLALAVVPHAVGAAHRRVHL